MPIPLHRLLGPTAGSFLEAADGLEDAVRELRLGVRRALGLGSTDLSALWGIHRAEMFGEPVQPSELSRRLGVSRGTMTAVVDRLLAVGLVERCEVEGDRRARVLRITPDGRRRLGACIDGPSERMRSALDALPAEHVEGAAEVIRLLTEALSPSAQQESRSA